jgi:hypothetical protein
MPFDAMKALGDSVPASQPADFTTMLTTERAAWNGRVKFSGFTAAD